MDGPYNDHILQASDVCSTCHRRTRGEFISPYHNGTGWRADSDQQPIARRTVVEHHDSVPEPTHDRTVFCDRCGTDDPYVRLWDPTEISRDDFKHLLRNTLRTLAEKGVHLSYDCKRETISYALLTFDEGGDADRALGRAIEMGVVAQANSDADADETEQQSQ
jgi:hypothetical protein